MHEGASHTTAFVGDNDRMFHRVRPVGRREDGMLGGMTLDTRLEHEGGDAWRVADGEDTRARLRFDALRISLSWKAEVFRDASECALVDAHTDDLTLDDVFARFRDDLEPRGVPWPAPTDPIQDPPHLTHHPHHNITTPS